MMTTHTRIHNVVPSAIQVTAAAVPVVTKKDVKEPPPTKAKAQVPKYVIFLARGAVFVALQHPAVCLCALLNIMDCFVCSLPLSSHPSTRTHQQPPIQNTLHIHIIHTHTHVYMNTPQVACSDGRRRGVLSQ